MSESVRDLLAACCLCRDDIRAGMSFSEERASQVIRDGREAEHFGDCTKVATSCVRCAVDEAFAAADIVLTMLDAAGLVVVPKTPTEEMLTASERVLLPDEDGRLWPTTFDRSESSAVYAAMLKAATKP